MASEPYWNPFRTDCESAAFGAPTTASVELTALSKRLTARQKFTHSPQGRMPAYQLHRLSHPGGDPEPTSKMFHGDEAAMRFAMRDDFADGCDVWQGQRYVGRVHRAAAGGGEARTDAAARDASPPPEATVRRPTRRPT